MFNVAAHVPNVIFILVAPTVLLIFNDLPIPNTSIIKNHTFEVRRNVACTETTTNSLVVKKLVSLIFKDSGCSNVQGGMHTYSRTAAAV